MNRTKFKFVMCFFVGLSCVSSSAISSLEVHQQETLNNKLEGFAVFQPDFDYALITVERPLLVQVQSNDGNCSFKVSLVGLQGGESDLTGRVEEGVCHGQKVTEGIVRASSSSKGKSTKNSVLNRNVEVFLLK